MILRHRRREYRIPEGVRIYAVGDLHGRADLLDTVFSRIDAHESIRPSEQPIEVFLGDYVDRGPSSRDVIDKLLERSRSREVVCLKGNHEVFFEDFLKDPNVISEWQKFGGLETLSSYGLHNARSQMDIIGYAVDLALPQRHRDFLSSLQPFFICGDFFFVHAGVRPGVELHAQREEDLFWIRREFLEYTRDFGKIIVHGHTPVQEPDFRDNRINIDTGAYLTGRLTCVSFEGTAIHTVE